jgi:hypothetical protein
VPAEHLTDRVFFDLHGYTRKSVQYDKISPIKSVQVVHFRVNDISILGKKSEAGNRPRRNFRCWKPTSEKPQITCGFGGLALSDHFRVNDMPNTYRTFPVAQKHVRQCRESNRGSDIFYRNEAPYHWLHQQCFYRGTLYVIYCSILGCQLPTTGDPVVLPYLLGST